MATLEYCNILEGTIKGGIFIGNCTRQLPKIIDDVVGCKTVVEAIHTDSTYTHNSSFINIQTLYLPLSLISCFWFHLV